MEFQDKSFASIRRYWRENLVKKIKVYQNWDDSADIKVVFFDGNVWTAKWASASVLWEMLHRQHSLRDVHLHWGIWYGYINVMIGPEWKGKPIPEIEVGESQIMSHNTMNK